MVKDSISINFFYCDINVQNECDVIPHRLPF